MEEDSIPQSMQESDAFCDSVLSKMGHSTLEADQHLCAVLGTMSLELKDQNLPRTHLAYFGAASSALDRLLATDPDPPPHVLEALLFILSETFATLSPALAAKKFDYVSDLIVRALRTKGITPRGVGSGLNCICKLLTGGKGKKTEWSDISQLFGVLLSYITDDQPKVRKHSISYLYHVLSAYDMLLVLAPVLASASEAITNLFERSLLLAGGSNSNTSEGAKAAQQVLYVVDALKDCLPVMSMKSSTVILKYFKSLLELKQNLVSKRIVDTLNALCIRPNVEVSSDVLLDLLCFLASSVSADETSADATAFTARLLDCGMRKVYSLNRQICVAKLPLVFNALRDILASEHEEAIFASAATFKSLIDGCVDESLIKQGVDQIVANANVETRRSAPTIIEKVSATIESLLDYRFAAMWDMSFKIVSAMFYKLGEHSPYFLRGTLKSLADMQKLPDEDFSFRKQLHECFGSALGVMGPATFLSILPLSLQAEDLSDANVWLFPILKQYTVGARLSFFTESILPMVQFVRCKSAMLEQEGKIHSARSVDGLVYSIWSLLPSFCNYPLDTAESFNDLQQTLCSALRDDPDFRGIICSSLQILVQQNKKILEGKDNQHVIEETEENVPKRRAIAHYTPQIAAENLNVLRCSARDILSVLSGIFLQSPKDSGGLLQSTIGEFASISDKEVVGRFFKTTMHKLLKVTQEAGKVRISRNTSSMEVDNSSDANSLSLARAQLFDFAVSLLPGLDGKEIDLLFIAIGPALKDDEGLIQKKAYKVLSIILKNSDGFILSKLEELLQLMIEVLPYCHFSAKRHRLDCLYSLIVHASKVESEQRSDAITSFLTEIILALKEANKKTRNTAYDILVQIGHAYGDEEKGGNKENLHLFFSMVAGGLAGETPHMISAAVKGLARLAYEFSDLVSTAYNVLPSTFLLLQRKNREIIKASLGLLKVLVAKSQAEGLQRHLKSMVEGLLNWQDDKKNHFKAKVKLLLEMLVKKCGLDAVKAVMPEQHMKLLTNIRKIKERRERKLGSNSEDGRSQQSKATTSRLSRWNHTKIFSDDVDEDTDSEFMSSKLASSKHMKGSSLLSSKASLRSSKRMRKADKSLPEDLFDQVGDEPLDLLDLQKTRAALRSSHLKRKPVSDDEPEIDSEGRLVIHEERRKPERETSPPGDSDDERSQADGYVSVNSRIALKRRKISDSGWAYTGTEYASKKASGDVKRKDKLEPYAYWPLDRKMVSRRPEQRAAARKGMLSVVKLTKKMEGKSVKNALSMKGFLKFKRGTKAGTKRSR